MSTLRVFKATLPSVNYIFKNGKPAIFVNGMYTTDVPFEIEELDAEIATRHPHIFIDESMREIDSAKVDPIAALREKIIAEYQATMAAATSLDNDLGNSTQGALKPASSVDIAAASAGGSGAGLAARLVTMQTK